VAPGLTTILAEADPLLHTKLDAPVAVNVADPPTHIAEGALIDMLGIAFTFTSMLATSEQPFAFVPVTE
jgi:hypothetical protein